VLVDLWVFIDLGGAGTAPPFDGVSIAGKLPAWAGEPHVAADGAKALTIEFESIGAAVRDELHGDVVGSLDLDAIHTAVETHAHGSARRGQQAVQLACAAADRELPQD